MIKNKVYKKEYFIHGEILLLINDPLPDNINVSLVKKKLEKNIPKRLFNNLDYIYVGFFDELKARDVESAYLRGAIFISNENQTEDSLYAGIVHELAHSIEETFRETIYGDDEIATEFVSKRKKLRTLLKQENLIFPDSIAYIRTEYNPSFDKFFYETVGYDRLNQLIVNIFMSPYAVTSLREYFANGFEHFYLFDRDYLKRVCPKLYTKISMLTKQK